MPQVPVEDNSRLSVRIAADDKALLVRAAALRHTNLTDFVVSRAVEAAHAEIERFERVHLSERDSLRVLELLEHPPAPNERLLAAARALPEGP